MKKKNNNYQEAIKVLQEHPPVLEIPEELAAGIMNRITDVPQQRKRIILTPGIWLSGVAVILLIGFLIHELVFVEPLPSEPVLSYSAINEFRPGDCMSIIQKPGEQKNIHRYVCCFLKEQEIRRTYKKEIYMKSIK